MQTAADTSARETLSAVFTDEEIAAALDYTARRDRRENPPGTFDRAGRFELEEHCPHCAGIRTPSRAYPLTEMQHGRTALHCAGMHGADVATVRSAARILDHIRNAAADTGHQGADAARTLARMLAKAAKGRAGAK